MEFEPDKEADIEAAADRGEAVSRMEPVLVRESARQRGSLADLALELTAASTGLRRSLPEGVVTALSGLVRSMNCYYSNLIEGHDTHPVDIERALEGDYSRDPKTRDLQLEARAHIAVQRWIDEGGLKNRATSASGIMETHRRFCELLPEDLLWVENPETDERIRIVAGALRQRDVKGAGVDVLIVAVTAGGGIPGIQGPVRVKGRREATIDESVGVTPLAA